MLQQKEAMEKRKTKLGFEANDFELDDKAKAKANRPKIILTGFQEIEEQRKPTEKLIIPEDVKSVLKEAGVPVGIVENIRESGLTDGEVKVKSKEYELPSDEIVLSRKDLLADAEEVAVTPDEIPSNFIKLNKEREYKNLLYQIISLPWYKRFGALNQLILNFLKEN